jgi:hypothetical protein
MHHVYLQLEIWNLRPTVYISKLWRLNSNKSTSTIYIYTQSCPRLKSLIGEYTRLSVCPAWSWKLQTDLGKWPVCMYRMSLFFCWMLLRNLYPFFLLVNTKTTDWKKENVLHAGGRGSMLLLGQCRSERAGSRQQVWMVDCAAGLHEQQRQRTEWNCYQISFGIFDAKPSDETLTSHKPGFSGYNWY